MKLDSFLKVTYHNKKAIIQSLEKGTLVQIHNQVARQIQMS